MSWMVNFQQLCRWGSIIRKAKRSIKEKVKNYLRIFIKNVSSIGVNYEEGHKITPWRKIHFKLFLQSFAPFYISKTSLRMAIGDALREMYSIASCYTYIVLENSIIDFLISKSWNYFVTLIVDHGLQCMYTYYIRPVCIHERNDRFALERTIPLACTHFIPCIH